MGPPKRPVSRELPSRDPFLIDVPADGSCLFWSTALAYLIPVKDDEDGFKQRYTALFGNEKIIHISHVREFIQNYNPLLNAVPSDDILKDLVSNTFRNRVVDHIQSHEDEFRGYISGEIFQYLNDMREPDTWGDQPEIMAMSEMLGAKVTVSGATQSEHGDGDVRIQLFHVNATGEGERNHYNFVLPQRVIDAYNDNVENLPGQQSSAKPELIELLLTKPINTENNKGNPVLPMNRERPIGFAEKFSLFLEETPCIGSTSKKEFFIHAILGSVLTLPSSGLEQKFGIKNVYVKHDMKVESVKGQKVVSSDIIKLYFVFEKDGKKQIALRVFVNDETEDCKNLKNEYNYSDDQLKEIAEKLDISDIGNINVDKYVFRICTEGDPCSKSFKLYEWPIDVVKERLKKGSPPSQTDEFKKVSADNALDLGYLFKDLSSEEVEEVVISAKEIFLDFIKIHKKNKEEFSLFNSEASYHGFFYGALALNFKYRYGLNCYVERAGGNGRADLILISRTKDANNRVNPEPIPVIIEFKAGNRIASEAIKQIKNDGYLYNLSVRTRAKDAVIVGVNPAQSDALQVEQDVIFQSLGFINLVLEQKKKSNPDRVDQIKYILKGELKNLYYSIPSHDQHYLSKVIFGQVLAAEDGNLSKHIFIYGGKDKNIGKKTTTFVLSDLNKAVILNIIEHTQKEPEFDLHGRTRNSEKQASVSKILPIHELGIDSAVKINVKIRTGENLGGFEVEGNKYKSYYQDINIEEVSYISCKWEYSGRFEGIGNVNVGKLIQELKGKPTKTEPKDPLSYSREDLFGLSKTKLKNLSPRLSKNLFDRKELISKERGFQAILQGLFINGKDETGQEIRVYAESNVSPKGRMDLMLSFEEDCPIIIELKCADSLSKAKIELNKAEEQSDRKYNLIRSCTSKRTAYSLVMVFNKRAESADGLIFVNIKGVNVEHTTSENVSSSESINPTCEGQELYEFGSQADSSSEDNSGLVSQVDFFDTEQELIAPDFQAASPTNKRRKRTRSAEPYKELKRSVKPENYLDNVSVQVHSTQARDLGEM